jgi:hypothetical protein
VNGNEGVANATFIKRATEKEKKFISLIFLFSVSHLKGVCTCKAFVYASHSERLVQDAILKTDVRLWESVKLRLSIQLPFLT